MGELGILTGLVAVAVLVVLVVKFTSGTHLE
jgi:ribose/xylose/arabinose/galactoside ABC-type transport system permease subunit